MPAIIGLAEGIALARDDRVHILRKSVQYGLSRSRRKISDEDLPVKRSPCRILEAVRPRAGGRASACDPSRQGSCDDRLGGRVANARAIRAEPRRPARAACSWGNT